MLLGSQALSGQNVRANKKAGVSKVSSVAVPRVIARTNAKRATSVRVQAIFGLFGGQKDAAPANNNKAREYVEELIDLVSGKGTPSATVVNSLVKQLQPFGIKNPVKSKLLFGEYKLVYSSKPGAGSPVQYLEEPDVIREVSEFKSFGLLPGTSTQSGELNGLSGDTYEEVFDRLEVKSALNSEVRDVDVTRTVTVLYLDGDLRITRTVGQGESGEGTLNVYKRVAAGEEEEEEEKKQGTGMVFFGGGQKEGIATISEREVLKKMAAAEAKGKANLRLPANLPSSPAAAVAARSGTGTARIGVKGTAPVKADPAVEAKRKEAEAKARELEAKKRAQEAAAAKEKAEADKKAAAERSAQIKAQLEALGSELREAQEEARQAAKEAKDLERNNGQVLKQVSNARNQLRSAAEDIEEVEEALSKAGAARAAAEAALKEALAGVNAAQSKLKAVK